MREELWSTCGRKRQASISPLLDGNVSIDFFVCEHSELKQEVRFKCGVQKGLRQRPTIWILRPGVNRRSDAFWAFGYDLLDFRLLMLSNKRGLRKTWVTTD